MFLDEATVDKSEAVKLITEFAEKIIPKKPRCERLSNAELVFSCPACKNKIISKIDNEWCTGRLQKYCDECGQALLWEELI